MIRPFALAAHPHELRPASAALAGHEQLQEIVAKRRANSKTFHLGGDQYKTVVSPVTIHYDSNGSMEEIDLTIRDVDGKKQVVQAPYKVEVFTDRVGYRMDNPDGSHFTIELVAIGGVDVDNSTLDVTHGDMQVFWDGLVPGVSMKVLLGSTKPEIFTQLNSASAARSFTWKVVQKGKFEFTSFGGDADQDVLEIQTTQRELGAENFLYTEVWTGRVSRRDPKTRVKTWFDDPVYPVVIDPTVTVSISSNNDDGREYGGAWHSMVSYLGALSVAQQRLGGFRFQNVGVPAGATITSATLKITTKATGVANTMKVWGDKVANAAAWSSSSRPTQITKTTASTNWTASLNAVNSIDVLNQVASIVALGGWASNNAMRFAVLTPTDPTHYFYVFDHNTSVPNCGQLVIVYTAGGGGGTSVGITGQEITVSRGSVTPSIAFAPAGQVATVQRGTVVPNDSVALVGQAVTLQQDAVTAVKSVALSGQAVTVQQGSVASTDAVPLTGQVATVQQGSVASTDAVPLSGQSVTVQQGSVAPADSVALTGQAATIQQGSVTPNDAVTLAGQQITLQQGTVTPVTGTVVAITGQQIAVQSGGVTANDAVPLVGQSVAVQQGAVTPVVGIFVALTGQQVSVQQGGVTTAALVALAGQQVSVQQGTSVANTLFRLAGLQLATQQGTVIPVVDGGNDVSHALVGTSLTVQRGAFGVISSGSFALVGQQLTISAGLLGIGNLALARKSLNLWVTTRSQDLNVRL